jgi:ABC-type Mn2+/Zn2+ transport system ATPase subunit
MPSVNSSEVNCALRAPATVLLGVPFTINLQCSVEGRCATPPAPNATSPPPSPPPPPVLPPPDIGHFCAIHANTTTCTYLVLLGPLSILFAVLIAVALRRAAGNAVTISCRVCRLWRTRRFRASHRAPTPPSLSLFVPAAIGGCRDAPSASARLLEHDAHQQSHDLSPTDDDGRADADARANAAAVAAVPAAVAAAQPTTPGAAGAAAQSNGAHQRRPSEGCRAAAAFALSGGLSSPSPRSLRTSHVARPSDEPDAASRLATVREAAAPTDAGGGGGGGGACGAGGGAGSGCHHRRAVSAPIGAQADGWAAAGPGPASLSWRGVGYAIRGKQLLPPCSGKLNAGLCAMLGPSGAGKSTLLGVLCGRKRHGEATGEVRIHGYLAAAGVRRARIGYVTQDDLLPGTSTISEHLAFHTLLRCPWLGSQARAALVSSALEAVALTPKADRTIGDGYVRGLSGGERRRVSVAVELLVAAARAARVAGSGEGAAPILLMDEPFSGLDSHNARLLLHALVAVAHGGGGNGSGGGGGGTSGNDLKPGGGIGGGIGGVGGATASGSGGGACVMLSVHQPTSRFMRAMSSCIVMAPGGHVLFAGPTRTPEGRCAMSVFFDGTRGSAPRLRELSPNSAEAVIELVSATDDATRQRLARIVLAIDWSAGGEVGVAASGRGGSRVSEMALQLEAGWRQGAWSSGFWTQLWALTRRSWTLMVRATRCG